MKCSLILTPTFPSINIATLIIYNWENNEHDAWWTTIAFRGIQFSDKPNVFCWFGNHASMHTCIQVYMHTCVHTYVHPTKLINVYVYIYIMYTIYIYIYNIMYTCINMLYLHMCICMHLPTDVKYVIKQPSVFFNFVSNFLLRQHVFVSRKEPDLFDIVAWFCSDRSHALRRLGGDRSRQISVI